MGGTVGFFKSIDAGVNWNPSNSGLRAMIITSIAVAPSSPDRIYTIAGEFGLVRSSDYGLSWERLMGPEYCDGYSVLTVEHLNENHVYVLGGP